MSTPPIEEIVRRFAKEIDLILPISIFCFLSMPAAAASNRKLPRPSWRRFGTLRSNLIK